MNKNVHDMGGDPAGPIDRAEHSRTLFDQRVDAMRRSIESLDPQAYHELAYYERWVRAVRELAIERGLVSQTALEQRMAAIAAQRVVKP